MSTPIYQIRALKKTYGPRRVLQIEALDIFSGEIFALVGPSGAGKSTLLRMLNFLETPTHGQIRFLNWTYAPDHSLPLDVRRRVTTVFQRPVLLAGSVNANVEFGLRLRRRQDARQYAQAAIARVGLSDLANQRARTLSGGEAQRVALARAIVLEPDVMLLDEPTANLDPHNVGLIEQVVRQQNRQAGITVVLVTHNVFQARRLADRVGLLLEGRLIEVAETDKFFGEPCDPRTAAFIAGEMIY